MKHCILLAITLASSSIAYGSQFDGVVDAIAPRSSSPRGVRNSWEEAQKIKGVKWAWPYHQAGAHDNSMIGTTKVGKSKNPNIGLTNVAIYGARTFINSAEITIQNEGENPSNESVNRLFGKGAVDTIKTSCDADEMSMGVAAYKFTKPGYNPVYVFYEASWGASGGGSVTIKIANDIGDVLNDCKIINGK